MVPLFWCCCIFLLPHSRGCWLFYGGDLSLGPEGWPFRWFIFITNTLWVKVICRWQALFYGKKCDEESAGWAGVRTLLHVYLHYFFPDVSCQRQLQLLRYFCLVQSTRPQYVKPAYPFTLVRFSNNTALILPPEAYQGRSEISPLATSERFTLRWRRGIGVLMPHPKASVNGASDSCQLVC